VWLHWGNTLSLLILEHWAWKTQILPSPSSKSAAVLSWENCKNYKMNKKLSGGVSILSVSAAIKTKFKSYLDWKIFNNSPQESFFYSIFNTQALECLLLILISISLLQSSHT
jgi:hypothetical protein